MMIGYSSSPENFATTSSETSFSPQFGHKSSPLNSSGLTPSIDKQCGHAPIISFDCNFDEASILDD